MEFLESRINDPAWNLALEQYVFDHMDRSKSYFMLWQNDNTIVIGRYQNTIAEINNDFVRENNIHVVRRLSGGGAVYHDMGNLNFTFIMDAKDADKINFHMFCEPIVQTLASFGVKAEITGRNDMTVDGRKFSGNAQYIRQGRVMHHGCIMVHADTSVLGRALHVDQQKIAAKGVKSVVSRVANLCEFLPEGVGVPEFKARLVEILSQKEEFHPCTLSQEDFDKIEAIKKERYDTWDWNYGRSPAYVNTRKQRIEGCGTVEVSVSAEKGEIQALQFFGDFFALGDIEELAQKLVGTQCRRQALEEKLTEIKPETYIRNLSAQALAELIAP